MMEENFMDAQTILEPVIPAEPVYIIPAHPAASAPLSVETVTIEEPTAAEDSLSDLIQQAMTGLRSELMAELQKEPGGEINVKG
jgi:hypothetical protein